MKSKMISLLFVLGFSFFLWGCTGSQEEKTDLVALGDVITEFRAAVNSARTDEILLRYAEDAIILPANEDVVVGKQAVSEFWNRRAYVGIELVEEQVAMNVTGSIAYEVNTSTFKYQLEGQDPVDSGPSKNVRIWKKQADGAWKLLVDVWNSSVPQQMPGSDISQAVK
ncbi:MAG: YybH family protein [bacterium]